MDYQDILKTTEARDNFMKGLIRLAKAVGNISQEESQYFIGAANSMGLSEQQIEEIKGYINSQKELPISFQSMAEKVLFFREAIQLCAIDIMYTREEKEEIRKIAEELNVSIDLIKEIEKWVEQGMAWKRQGDELVSRYL